MPKEPQPLEKLFSEHGVIEHLIDVASQEMTDINTFFSLQTESFEWSQVSIQELSSRQKELSDTIAKLQKEMLTHFAYEKKSLPRLIGDLLTKGLMLEHREIAAGFDRVKTALAEPLSGNLPQRELLAKKTALQQSLEKLSGLIEAHAKNEDVMFRLLQKVNRD